MWQNPLPYKLIPTDNSNSFELFTSYETGLPIGNHVGAFGVKRKHHIHEGVDLYVPSGTPVSAVESGIVVRVCQFTGPNIGSPWWNDTYAVFVKGKSGIVVYGEISSHIKLNQEVVAGELVGCVVRVLKSNKGRPTSMLHLELRDNNINDIDWQLGQPQPAGLLDPTNHLLRCIDRP